MNDNDPRALVPTTLGGLRRQIAARLKAAFAAGGHESSTDLDARLLVAEAARIEPGQMPLREDAPIAAAVAGRALAFAERRIAGEPVARILGRKEFWGLQLVLSAATLVPRPDTETVVDAALAFIRKREMPAPRILDLGTGSGAILLAVLSELPSATGVGGDASAAAIATARGNAARLGLGNRSAFVVGDWTAPVGDIAFDVVVANPPYIPTRNIAALPREVREHDPPNALDGGTDGLDAVRIILSDLRRVLAPGGAAFIEIGSGQAATVAELARGHGLACAFTRDLAGIDRVAVLTP